MTPHHKTRPETHPHNKHPEKFPWSTKPHSGIPYQLGLPTWTWTFCSLFSNPRKLLSITSTTISRYYFSILSTPLPLFLANLINACCFFNPNTLSNFHHHCMRLFSHFLNYLLHTLKTLLLCYLSILHAIHLLSIFSLHCLWFIYPKFTISTNYFSIIIA